MNDNFNEDFWWEAIDEYVISEIMEFKSNLNDYYSHLQILLLMNMMLKMRMVEECVFIKVFLLIMLMSLNLILEVRKLKNGNQI